MGLVEAALSEQPDDPSARELYAVTHLARSIRLSDKAREARRTDLLRREIDYDHEFHDVPEVARTFAEAIPASDDVLRVHPAHWKWRLLKAAWVSRRHREA